MSAATAVPTKAKEEAPTIMTFNISNVPCCYWVDSKLIDSNKPMIVTSIINSALNQLLHTCFLANVAEITRSLAIAKLR